MSASWQDIENSTKAFANNIMIEEGKIVEKSKPNEIYLALFQRKEVIGWQVSSVIYHRIEEVESNLAAFNPTKILIVKVKIPVEDKEML